jgi:hypothetical protein
MTAIFMIAAAAAVETGIGDVVLGGDRKEER